MQCAIKKTIRTGAQCVNEGIIRNPVNDHLICADCAEEHDYLIAKLKELRIANNLPTHDERFNILIGYNKRN